MLKRVFACLLVACLLLGMGAIALAEPEYIGDMTVIKCKEAVNLREGPSTDTPSLGLVPLGTVVTGCTREAGQEWVHVNFGGTLGYIRGDFLEAVPVPETVYANEFTILDEAVKGLHILADQQYADGGEQLQVVCIDGSGREVWRQETATSDVTELTQTDAFIGGTLDMPIVLMYNAEQGLTALDVATGSVLWTLSRDTVHLGASISRAVDAGGTMYIGGYYGPDPVAIDMNGNVLWQSDSGSDDIFWLYSMELRDNGIACHYGSMGESDSGWVLYDFNGQVVEITSD
ncbi:MAG: SH3 domain-containing protein [Clostridia bacterium]|nr:SH3 domain-containing protein [Clostridia bacterium]